MAGTATGNQGTERQIERISMNDHASKALTAGEAYKALLLTDEWRQFSDHVRRLYGNICQCCRLGGRPTHVHHHHYEPGKLPWEYELSSVTLLCSSCHGELHVHLKNFRRFVFPKMRPRIFQIINGALLVAFENNDPLLVAHAIASMCASPGSIKRFALEGKSIVESEVKTPAQILAQLPQ